MSIPDSSTSRSGGVKTLAIRLEPDVHAQLSLIAQLRGRTITDEIRTALEAHLALARSAPELAAQADSALDEIEREASARREAIATLFGQAAPAQPAAATGSSAEPVANPAPASDDTVTGRSRRAPRGGGTTDSSQEPSAGR